MALKDFHGAESDMLNNNMLDFMSRFSDACAQANTEKDLNAVLKDSFSGLSAKVFSYIHCPPLGVLNYRAAQVVTFFGYTPEWAEFYRKRKCGEEDPFIAYAFGKNKAFAWDEAINQLDHDASTEEFISEVKNLGVGSGYAFPVFGARYRSGFFTIGFEDKSSKLNPFQLSMLQWACQLAHYRFVEIKCREEKTDIKLTPREKEILKWVAHGEKNSAISRKLQISKHTIDGYLRNIYLKLDVQERVSASHRAIALGLV